MLLHASISFSLLDMAAKLFTRHYEEGELDELDEEEDELGTFLLLALPPSVFQPTLRKPIHPPLSPSRPANGYSTQLDVLDQINKK